MRRSGWSTTGRSSFRRKRCPTGYNGIVWFLDESNRAHPTVIQTLFQIITERTCGEHALPEGTSIVLAGNLGEGDDTTITEFDDSALDGRLAVFQLRPSARGLARLGGAGRDPSVDHPLHLALPGAALGRGEHQPEPAGLAPGVAGRDGIIRHRHEEELLAYLRGESRRNAGAASSTRSWAWSPAADFIAQLTAPRGSAPREILAGDEEKLAEHGRRGDPGGGRALGPVRRRARPAGDLSIGPAGATSAPASWPSLANVLLFIGAARADSRLSFFYLLLRDCGIFTQVPAAIRLIPDEERRKRPS